MPRAPHNTTTIAVEWGGDDTVRPIRVFYDYTVQGSGGFPIDMLRFDSCWPKRQEDATNIERFPPANPREIRRIQIRSYCTPTNNRWASYGWTITDQTIAPA